MPIEERQGWRHSEAAESSSCCICKSFRAYNCNCRSHNFIPHSSILSTLHTPNLSGNYLSDQISTSKFHVLSVSPSQFDHQAQHSLKPNVYTGRSSESDRCCGLLLGRRAHVQEAICKQGTDRRAGGIYWGRHEQPELPSSLQRADGT